MTDKLFNQQFANLKANAISYFGETPVTVRAILKSRIQGMGTMKIIIATRSTLDQFYQINDSKGQYQATQFLKASNAKIFATQPAAIAWMATL